jgi:hypothetical protein
MRIEDLSAGDRRKAAQLGEHVLRSCQDDHLLAALACLIAAESVAFNSDEPGVRCAIAVQLIRSALLIDPSVLDTRH